LRPGYLAALASRALGVAPVLRPATPSRFEPVGPHAEPRAITEVRVAAGRGPAATPRQVPDRPDEPDRPDQTEADALAETDRSLPGFFAADIAGEHRPVQVAQNGWWAPGVTEPAGEPAGPAGGSRRSAPLPTGDLADVLLEAARPLRGFFAADIAGEHRPVQVAQDGWGAPGVTEPAGEPAGRSRRSAPLPATAATGVEALANAAALTPDAAGAPSGRAWSGMAATAALLPGGRVTWQEGAVQTGRSRQQAQAAGRAGEPEEARNTEPTIVVRIGRVDVRAVQAAPPPAPPPRPRPPAGPSLAEHLRARDRGRR